MTVRFLGVYREKRFSPGVHAAGDRDILELTHAALARQGCRSGLVAPEALVRQPPTVDVVFAMCQAPEPLAVLEQWERQGILVLNTPAAVRGCYRLPLVRTLSQAHVPFPRSRVVPLGDVPLPAWPLLPNAAAGCWVKRGDVHAMQADDVVFVRHAADWCAQVGQFRQRGIHHAIVQEHVAGVEIKFYALRGHGVLHAFTPHAPAAPDVDLARLQALVCQVGDVLHLDVYGGDCILTPDGQMVVVDVNDWPSFRGCRPQAAEHIAQHLLARAQARGLF